MSFKCSRNSFKDSTSAFQSVFEIYELKLQEQKTFMNQVVHDMRNPAESIYLGLQICQKELDQELTKIVDFVLGQVDFIQNDENSDKNGSLKKPKFLRNDAFICAEE